VNGVIANWTNPGGSFLGSATNFTTDAIPDIIEKLAFDPGWAHFELFGVQRFFSDNTFSCSILIAPGVCPPLVDTFTGKGTAISVTNSGTTNNHTTTGAGIGGSFLWSILPNTLDLSGMMIAGNGIGRYSAAQLPDVIVAGDGTLHPIKEIAGMGGAVWHPWAGLDIYAYGGIEKEDANFYTASNATLSSITGVPVTTINKLNGGLGNPNIANFGCDVTTAASFSGGTSNCNNGANHWVTDITVGLWQNLYNGDIGRFTAGLQYEYISRKLFAGLSGPAGSPLISPSTNNNVFFTSLRWYPKYPTF
jgi:hypothetical protein